MKTTHEEIRCYLGDMGINEFESEDQIREYMTVENIRFMFGGTPETDPLDLEDIARIRDNMIDDWREMQNSN